MKNNKTTTTKKYHWLLICILMLCFVSTKAQDKMNIAGQIIDETGMPLLGVNVLIEGTNRGAVSDFDGNFEIKASKGEVLVFSSLGFMNQSITIGDNTTISIVLAQDSQELEQVVVIGYGTQRKIEVTGAVNSVSAEVIAKAPVSDVAESLQGQIAGVNIQASNGRPGEEANIQIRGIGSLSPGSLGPLFVVDGIPFQGNPNIAPEQIESIDILKDGASAAVYGVRAANGVILITTKKGKQGQLKVDYSTYLAVQNITSGVPLMNTSQQLFSDQAVNDADGTVNNTFFLNPNALDFDSDFVGDVQNDNALIQNHNLNISGGVGNLSLNINGSYFDQEGVLINSGFNRLTTRITGQYTKERLKIFTSIGITDELRIQEPFALLEQAVAQRPFQPPISNIQPVNGVVQLGVGTGQPELLSFLTRLLNDEDERRIRSSNIAFSLDYEILQGLTYKVNLGRNNWNFRRNFLRPQYLLFNVQGDFVPGASREDAILQESFIFTQRNTIENSLNYNVDFGNHNIKLLALASYEQFDSKNLSTGVIGLASNDTPVLGQGQEPINPSGFDITNKLNGLLGRVQYNFDDRYLLSASVRRDGSSNFPTSNRFKVFYGVSAGWNISEEPFFKNANLDFINNFKLRGSIAEVGNQTVAGTNPTPFIPTIESGVNFIFGEAENLAFGQIGRRLVDPNIQWETKISRNVGIDLSMFSNKLSFTADYYLNDRKDLLLEERLPPSTGTSAPRDNSFRSRVVNAGNLTNQGIELALSYKDQTTYGLKWNVGATFTQNVNEVTDLNGTSRGFSGGTPVFTVGNVDNTTFLAEGFEAGAFFLLQNEGVIQTQEELLSYQQIVPDARIGDIAYIDQPTVDTDGDGVPDTADGTINDDDRVYAGSGQAEFEAGLNLNLEYKGFDFFIQNYFSYGAEVYNGARLSAYINGRHEEQFNQWTPQNPTSNIPARRAGNVSTASTRARSDFFLEDGSYWRIRNITLGYSIPKDALPNFFSKFRIYATSQNPFTFTEYTGFDPEIGGDGIFTRGVDQLTYPVSRRILFGVQLGF
ncbi:TonB-dependent receptor [Aquimarina sp. AD1]|uniref:SusC/RagA family TonB-linked outer membrane protein n=1 Tax=Aquimarina sp. (strain AD1) TaxID=1714848 RepID=UPI000E529E67|nr:TonB-dependent receptor [Aquimarina sp. AD1]AXT56766.1 TonB-dependent receptor [Aquimarina sp. AD1]RKN13892.1 SusC/RagA family TonB-linked outer membrane protein [Aquimarina sp. AD1]